MPVCFVAQSRSLVLIWMSPRFAEMFDASAHRALKRDKFKLHFQYLMATDLPVPNDYFAITAGPKPLAHWMQPPT